jgi:NAD(P)-dependent dehydrogenase (short-subunit alcohol dehydrogenase family)
LDTGAKLALVDRSPERVKSILPQIADSLKDYAVISADLTNMEDTQKAVNAVLDRFGQIDVLVNTVGGYRAGKPVHETSLETWDFMLNLNARTTLITCKLIIPSMIERQFGKIINIAARAALSGSANSAAYSASKSAVVRLTESMSAELKSQSININCILPSIIDTPQNRQSMPNADFSRWVEPQAIADVILFLASDAARAVHGAAIPVYGLS